jgi:hypothetical protein
MNAIRNEIDKTALSYWFPKLVEAGIPVPKTKIVKMPDKAQKVIWKLFDGITTASTADTTSWRGTTPRQC